ncbi:unnamed protein product [marine sediment metagenome]|uniref:Uncharacterized protein n=1 Tax=marine sediment metagenome TaxID=412755 RepID=X1NXZ7_9ZZZZ
MSFKLILYLYYKIGQAIFNLSKKGIKTLLEKEKAKKILGSKEEYQKFLRSKKKEKQIALQSALQSESEKEFQNLLERENPEANLLTIEDLEKIKEILYLELILESKSKKREPTTKQFEEIKKFIYSALKLKDYGAETPEFQKLKELQAGLEIILVSRDEKETLKWGLVHKKFMKDYEAYINSINRRLGSKNK